MKTTVHNQIKYNKWILFRVPLGEFVQSEDRHPPVLSLAAQKAISTPYSWANLSVFLSSTFSSSLSPHSSCWGSRFAFYVGWGIFCAYWLAAFLLRSKAAFLCRGLPPRTAATLIVNDFPTVTRPDSHSSMFWLHSSTLNISPAVLMAHAASKRAPFYINSGWMGVISHAKLMEENSSCPLVR